MTHRQQVETLNDQISVVEADRLKAAYQGDATAQAHAETRLAALRTEVAQLFPGRTD